MSDRIPAEVFHPSEHIRDELEARGWDEAEFAERGGFSLEKAHALVSGADGIDRYAADGLARAFGTSFQIWLNLMESWAKGLERELMAEWLKRHPDGPKEALEQLITEHEAMEKALTGALRLLDEIAGTEGAVDKAIAFHGAKYIRAALDGSAQ